jgi:tetratricopeptide (TPR) repeat protein
MLFDLRGRGRRRTVQVIYVTLAILMGGGLVLFGIGGATSGGLVDAFTGGGGGGGDDTYEKAVEKAQERVQTSPNDAAAWAALARAQAQIAGTGDNYDQNTGYTKDAQDDLRAADRAWQKYLSLKPAKVDGNVASVMVQIYVQPGGLNSAEKAVAAQEYVIDSQPESYGLYAQLAQYAYAAGQTRKGDLAAKKAVELAPEDQKNTLKQSLDEVKTSASGGGATGGATGASG